jgi:hypothetical protein
MSRTLRIDLFCEDEAHEELLKHLLRRICNDEGVEARIEVRSARGGCGRAVQELEAYQLLIRKTGQPLPDLLVVAIDANCSSYAVKVREIREKMRPELFPHCAIACPDPHIERWYMADPEAFLQVVGVEPPPVEPKCDKQSRNVLKKALATSVKAAGHPAILSGIEFAAELAHAMDRFRAGKDDPALKHFLEEVLDALRQLKGM